jgi:hypothetical protein
LSLADGQLVLAGNAGDTQSECWMQRLYDCFWIKGRFS